MRGAVCQGGLFFKREVCPRAWISFSEKTLRGESARVGGPFVALLLSTGVAHASLGCSTGNEVIERIVCKAGW